MNGIMLWYDVFLDLKYIIFESKVLIGKEIFKSGCVWNI